MKSPKGFLFAGISAGIKKSNKLDLGLVYSQDILNSVCFFTANTVKAAPLLNVMKKINQTKGQVKALLVNSGNANCFTGSQGIKDAEYLCKKVSSVSGAAQKHILPCSTGVIGKRLPVKKISSEVDRLFLALKKDYNLFAESILTTDKVKKVSSEKFKCGSKQVNILGVAKGAGMVHPQLKQATMLAFIFTDVLISKPLLTKAAKETVLNSFGSITIDGCTSTNDSVFVLTSGKAENKNINRQSSKEYKLFVNKLDKVCKDLAKKIVKDAEGSTKFIEVTVKRAKNKAQAKKAAFSVANSNLFKTAMYGENPNWGRIYQAIGQAGILVKDNVTVKTGSLKKKNIKLEIDLKSGKETYSVYTSDLTPEYVKINAEYS